MHLPLMVMVLAAKLLRGAPASPTSSGEAVDADAKEWHLRAMIGAGTGRHRFAVLLVFGATAGCGGNGGAPERKGVERPEVAEPTACYQQLLKLAWPAMLPRFVSLIEREPQGAVRLSLLSSLSQVATVRA